MGEPPADPLGALRAALVAAVGELGDGVLTSEPDLERPPRPELGDFATNAAMLAAPPLGQPPRALAERIGELLRERHGGIVERVEVAGPGFLNLFMADRWYRAAVEEIRAAGPAFGSGVAANPRRILVEFVSANPTGPLTVASGRHAAYGDSLARVLEHAGHDVEREYYLNDTGRQVRLLGESIAARMRGTELPEGGYEGAYVIELADALAGEVAPDDVEELARRGVAAMRERIERSLERYRVRFDRWSSERELHEGGAVDSAIDELRSGGHVYEREGAVWLRTSELGDDKDRVLIRADGEPTYFAGDVAYHRDKLGRGDLLVNVLGADHHGYVARVRAAIAALGGDPARFEAPIMQLVHLVEGGRRAQMSKRKGEFATLDELVSDIGVDAARFFLVGRSHETPIDLDLEVARSRSTDNPVYYVQYAHARIASIFRTARERGGSPPGQRADEGPGPVPAEPAERSLILRLCAFPDAVRRAEMRREPHTLVTFSRELAADFHAFYRDCRVVGATDGAEGPRLAVSEATRSVIATALGLLGVEAPEAM